MTPCSNQRALIAELTLNALDTQKEQRLRAHLETCAGCRDYLAELSSVTKTLSAIEIRSDIQTSEIFHRKLKARLQAEQTGSAWEIWMAQFRAIQRSWGLAFPIFGATAVAVTVLSVFVAHLGDRHVQKSSAAAGRQAAIAPRTNPRHDLDPTISNYQMIANQSLEKLDDLLTRQGNQNPPPSPLYTASALALADRLD